MASALKGPRIQFSLLTPSAWELPLTTILYKPLASLSVPLTCPHSVNSFFITASSWVPPGLILFPAETLMDTALKGKWCLNAWRR